MELPDNIAFFKKIGRSQPFSGPEFEMRIGHNIPKILGETSDFTAAHQSTKLFRDYQKMGSKDPKMQI